MIKSTWCTCYKGNSRIRSNILSNICPLLSLKITSLCLHSTMGSSSNSLFSVQNTFCLSFSKWPATTCPSICVLDLISLLHLLGHCLTFFFIPNSSSWFKTFKIIFILEQKKVSDTTQLPFITQTFKQNAIISLHLTLTTFLDFTPFLKSRFGLKVLSWEMLCSITEKRVRLGVGRPELNSWISHLLPEPHFLHSICYKYQMS